MTAPTENRPTYTERWIAPEMRQIIIADPKGRFQVRIDYVHPSRVVLAARIRNSGDNRTALDIAPHGIPLDPDDLATFYSDPANHTFLWRPLAEDDYI